MVEVWEVREKKKEKRKKKMELHMSLGKVGSNGDVGVGKDRGVADLVGRRRERWRKEKLKRQKESSKESLG